MTEYKRFENTPGYFRSVRIVEKQNRHKIQHVAQEYLIEISNEATRPFSDRAVKMSFTVDSLKEIAGWAEREIEKLEKR